MWQAFLLWGLVGWELPGWTLPDPADTPEEVLRHQEQIWEARSPLDNTTLDLEAYTALMRELEAAQDTTPQLAPEVQQAIIMLNILKVVRSVNPF